MLNYVQGKGVLYFRFIVLLLNQTFLMCFKTIQDISIGESNTVVSAYTSKAPDHNLLFPIYTKLCYRKRALNEKLKHKLYSC